jgi:spermidine synthase
LTEPEILEHCETDIGMIYLRRRPRDEVGNPGWVSEIQINGHLLMSSVDPVSERALATKALSMHEGDGPRRVLVGGLGLGYTAAAALEGPGIAKVRVVERMDFIIEWMNRGLFPLSETLVANERVEIVQGDVYEDLLGPASETYDLILIDVDHAPHDPLSPTSKPFYQVEGQRRVSRHLAPGGLLGVWSAHDDDAFADVLATVYPKSHRERIEWPDREVPGATYRNLLFMAVRP